MAFNTLNWVRSAAYGYEGEQVPVDFKYGSTADTKAATLAADFFLAVYEQLTIGSMIQFTASDATLTLAMVTAATSSTVTLAEITETLPPGSVDTADIADGAVTAPKLGTDIVAYIAIARENLACTATTSQSFTITGVLATDNADAIMTAGFSQPIVGAVCTAGTVTLHYAAAALPTDEVSIVVLRDHP